MLDVRSVLHEVVVIGSPPLEESELVAVPFVCDLEVNAELQIIKVR